MIADLPAASAASSSMLPTPSWPPPGPTSASMHLWGMLPGLPAGVMPAAAAGTAFIPAARNMLDLQLAPVLAEHGLLLGPAGAAPDMSSLAKRKAGRPKAPDPRDDPTIPEKKARRIMANRESADRSKRRQKLAQQEAHARQEDLKAAVSHIAQQMQETQESMLLLEVVQSAINGTPTSAMALASLQHQLHQQPQASTGQDPQLLLQQLMQQQQQQQQAAAAYPLAMLLSQLAAAPAAGPSRPSALTPAVVSTAATAAAPVATQASEVQQGSLLGLPSSSLQPQADLVLPRTYPAATGSNKLPQQALEQHASVSSPQENFAGGSSSLLARLLGQQAVQASATDAAKQPGLQPEMPQEQQQQGQGQEQGHQQSTSQPASTAAQAPSQNGTKSGDMQQLVQQILASPAPCSLATTAPCFPEPASPSETVPAQQLLSQFTQRLLQQQQQPRVQGTRAPAVTVQHTTQKQQQ